MRLIILGPPGSGKGTQARLLCERLNLVHVGTGDILREAVRLHTAAGRQAEPYVNSGRLVPDSLINDLVNDCFRREDRPQRFVMDGYPRTLAQAAAFDQVLRQQFLDLQAAVRLLVDDEEIIRRLPGRWSCPGCKATYHTVTKPPKVLGICDDCGSTLLQRSDDKVETIRQRLATYHMNTEELIPHYRSQGLLIEVPGVGGIEDIHTNIIQALNHRTKPTC